MLALIVVAVVLVGLAALTLAFYVKTPPNMAFVRTGLGGKKVVLDGGALVWPGVQSLQWISLETMKLEVFKAHKEAFITRDRMRVDIGAEFYVKVEPTPAGIERASRSLGEKSFSAQGVQALVEEKLVSALRSVAARMDLVEMHENRRAFALEVMETLREALVPNGLVLEDVAIFHLDQTDRAYLDPGNIFDAEGLRQIAAQTSERSRQRNEIERNTEVAIKRKDVEAVKLKLALDQEREFAEAEQLKAVETYRAQRRAETEQFKFEQERLTREAELARDRAIREFQILQERAVREAELRRETHLIQELLARERAEIDKERALEEARREKEIAVLLKERERLEEERRRLQAEAEREEAAQAVQTVARRAEAERQRTIALVEALREVEVARRRAEAAEHLAAARLREGDAEATVRRLQREAENAAEDRIVQRDLLLALIERAPAIARELMAPAQRIESIRVMDLRGAGDAGEPGRGYDAVVGAILRAGAALPLLRELLEAAARGGDLGGALRRAAEAIPGLKEVAGAGREPAGAA